MAICPTTSQVNVSLTNSYLIKLLNVSVMYKHDINSLRLNICMMHSYTVDMYKESQTQSHNVIPYNAPSSRVEFFSILNSLNILKIALNYKYEQISTFRYI